MPAAQPIAERMNKYTRRAGPDECWEWIGYRDKRGYGWIGYGKNMTTAHRVAWELEFDRKIPHGLCACHVCDNPCCVNPSHLFLGTRADNNVDKGRKGRARNGSHVVRGERHSTNGLTESQVKAIRADDRLHKVIAAEHGLARRTVSNIKARTSWAWLD